MKEDLFIRFPLVHRLFACGKELNINIKYLIGMFVFIGYPDDPPPKFQDLLLDQGKMS